MVATNIGAMFAGDEDQMLACNYDADNAFRGKPGERLHRYLSRGAIREHPSLWPSSPRRVPLPFASSTTKPHAICAGLKPADCIGLLLDKSIHAVERIIS